MGEAGGHHEPAAGARARLDRAPDERDALAKPDQPVACAVAGGLGASVVGDLDLDLVLAPADGDPCPRRARVLERVRERLLDHAVRRKVDARCELPRLPLDGELGRGAGFADGPDEHVHGAHRGLGGKVGHRPLPAQEPDQAPHLGQRLAAGGLDRLQRKPLALLPGLQEPPDGARLHRHHGDGVRDHVVELPRDARPLLGDGALRRRGSSCLELDLELVTAALLRAAGVARREGSPSFHPRDGTHPSRAGRRPRGRSARRSDGARVGRERVENGPQPVAVVGQPVLDARRPSVDHAAFEQARRLELDQPLCEGAGRDLADRLLEFVEAARPLRRGPEDRYGPASLEEDRRAADLLGDGTALATTRHAATCGREEAVGSSAMPITSSSDITGWNRSSSRTCSGTSWRSARLRSGITRSVRPAACAARTFCLRPPIGRTRPCSVSSPVIPTVCFTGRPVSRDASAVAIVMPALGPSFGIAPAGTCTWNFRSNASCSTPRRSAWERTEERAICADSFMTSPSWPVRTRPSPGTAVASTKRTSPPVALTARPVATPGTAVRSAASRKNFWRPSASRTASTSSSTGASASLVTIFVAVLRRIEPSSRSSWRTPASRVYSEITTSSTSSAMETSSSFSPARSRCRGQR